MSYVLESLPLQLALSGSGYVPALDIELADSGVAVAVLPDFTTALSAPWLAAAAQDCRVGSYWGLVPGLMRGAVVPVKMPGVQGGVCGFGWDVLQPMAGGRVLAWGVLPGALGWAVAGCWDVLSPQAADMLAPCAVASQVYGMGTGLQVQAVAVVHGPGWGSSWWQTDLYAARPDSYRVRQGELLLAVSTAFNLDDAPYIVSPDIAWLDVAYHLRAPVVRSSSAGVAVYQPAARADDVSLPWGEGVPRWFSPDLPYLVEDVPVVVPPAPDADLREVYLIVNSVNAWALPGLEPLPLADIKVALDRDSHSWRFSADVLGDGAMALLRPDATGKKELMLEINGHQWRFFIAAWSASRAVSDNALQKRYGVTGYSRTQYLGAGYAPQRTRSIGTTTAVQAAADELAGSGFNLVWPTAGTGALPDWALPDAIYSYQELTPLGAIRKLLDAVGGMLLPGMAADQLTVQPVYKVPPWELNTIAPDRTIHEAQVLSEGGQHESGAQINAVFVAGERAGVALNVVRAGTAGDMPGADVVDPWLTELEANKARGVHEIAASGDRVVHTLELAVPESAAQPGLLLPGLIVEVQHANAALDYRGYVVSVDVSAPGRGLATVRQTVVIEECVAWQA